MVEVIFMGVVGLDVISKRRERRKCSLLEIKVKIYEDVVELGRQGLKYKEIQGRIFKKYKMQLPMSTIFHWVNKERHPLGRVNKFNEKPSKELMYFIGAMLSDGCLYFDGNTHYLLQLATKDKEFAEKFARCLTKILRKEKTYKIFWNENRKLWIVEGYSILLYEFLNRPLEELKPYIEYSEETVASFLRAMFDGDGFMHKSQRILMLHNTNKELLIYAKYLLKKYFGIEATGPHLAKRKGSIIHSPNGKIYKISQDYYYIYIRAKSLPTFYKYIGFTIKRKQRRLIKAIK
jgi:intein-encoded DNA endonuclease-like protein